MSAEGHEPAREIGALDAAVSLLQAQSYPQVLTECDAILAAEPHRAEAHMLRAVALRALKAPAQALTSYERAISLKPDFAEAHFNLGNLHTDMGAYESALNSYDRALVARDSFAEAYFQRANVLARVGRLGEASQDYSRAIAVRADYSEAFENRARVERALGRPNEALASCGQAIAYAPQRAETYLLRGEIERELGDLEGAAASCDQAIALAPGWFLPYCTRAMIQHALGRFESALESCDLALALMPDSALIHEARALMLQELGRFEPALAECERALALKPDFADAYLQRGNLLSALGRERAAVESYDKSIELGADSPDARISRAGALLAQGALQEGFTEYESRWHSRGHGIDGRLWLGDEQLAGHAILLHAEQGLGDTLQFCRYAELVADRGARVIMRVPATLVELLKSVSGASDVIADTSPLPHYDYHCPLLSLPLAFKTTLQTIPARVPYLASDPARSRLWRERLGPASLLRVGLVWAGGLRPDQPQLRSVNERRNIKLAELASLASCSLVEFYSLQKGDAAEAELDELLKSGWLGRPIHSFSSELNNFADTAAMIEQLDLVISVDTSAAHLAGALGKPVWLLNRYDTCWRWFRERGDSPWYPTMRIYRQEIPGNWPSVVERVRKDLMNVASHVVSKV